MSRAEGLFCRSWPWRFVAGRAILPRVAVSADWSGTVVEVGGGSGAMADHLLRIHPEIDELVLVDIDPRMVDQATHRLARHGARTRAVLGGEDRLPVEESSVDVVCAWLMLHHVIVWERLLGQMWDALRPGGRVVGYDLTDAVLGRALHGVSRSDHRLIAPADLSRELERLGFVEIEVRPRGRGQVMTFGASKPAAA